jgi:hypothetical protein
LNPISGWLIGINFTFAFFSVNFTFFGYQLSRYKPIHDKLSKRQWINVIIVLGVPFVPIISFLIYPVYYAKIALWMMPIVLFSSIDNAQLTNKYLNPESFLNEHFSDSKISNYLRALYDILTPEAEKHEEYLKNMITFMLPEHDWEFHPDALGVPQDDLWDKVTLLIKTALNNNDYPVFLKCLEKVFRLLQQTYSYPSQRNEDYRELYALKKIAHGRLKAIIRWLYSADKEGTFVDAVCSRLCIYLKSEEAVSRPMATLTTHIAEDLVWIGKQMLSRCEDVQEPMKVLNTVHALVELGIHQIEKEVGEGKDRFLDQHNIAFYTHLIKSLGIVAVDQKEGHFIYRAMETLSFLGCNAAKIKANQTVLACFESLVQLGRASRKAKLGCFWNRCIIPLHKHAKEFMYNIVTWLIKDVDENGNFNLKGAAEHAYSRICGFKCQITCKKFPKDNSKTKIKIEEVIDPETGKPVPHIESHSGIYGFNGSLDYSAFDDLTEYVLRDYPPMNH